MVEVTTEASWDFLHVNCRQLSKFLFALSKFLFAVQVCWFGISSYGILFLWLVEQIIPNQETRCFPFKCAFMAMFLKKTLPNQQSASQKSNFLTHQFHVLIDQMNPENELLHIHYKLLTLSSHCGVFMGKEAGGKLSSWGNWKTGEMALIRRFLAGSWKHSRRVGYKFYPKRALWGKRWCRSWSLRAKCGTLHYRNFCQLSVDYCTFWIQVILWCTHLWSSNCFLESSFHIIFFLFTSHLPNSLMHKGYPLSQSSGLDNLFTSQPRHLHTYFEQILKHTLNLATEKKELIFGQILSLLTKGFHASFDGLIDYSVFGTVIYTGVILQTFEQLIASYCFWTYQTILNNLMEILLYTLNKLIRAQITPCYLVIIQNLNSNYIWIKVGKPLEDELTCYTSEGNQEISRSRCKVLEKSGYFLEVSNSVINLLLHPQTSLFGVIQQKKEEHCLPFWGDTTEKGGMGKKFGHGEMEIYYNSRMMVYTRSHSKLHGAFVVLHHSYFKLCHNGIILHHNSSFVYFHSFHAPMTLCIVITKYIIVQLLNRIHWIELSRTVNVELSNFSIIPFFTTIEIVLDLTFQISFKIYLILI
ncbi:hypothetical protein VP01_2699g2 [Puccinia sorghi]|uniref:Uncharacterized protein n=1 Tax=Puccinia sorghi TaxID=27349 RepID=A0A0L6V5J4_9BASI|nr:hypothetical protein VP01_2699g2 [Puccinia sorghi]